MLIADDFRKFIADTNPDLTEDEVTQIFDNVRLVGSESDFATLHKVYGWMVDGVQFTPQDGLARMIQLIGFQNWDKNVSMHKNAHKEYEPFQALFSHHQRCKLMDSNAINAECLSNNGY